MSESIEPFLVQEKIINDDGTPSDYLVRYLNNSLQQGKKTVKFPVTSVNGMTGDVVINLQDIVDGVDINYALLNEKIQEFIAALSAVRQEDIQRMADHQSDWHRWAYQSFHKTRLSNALLGTGSPGLIGTDEYQFNPTMYIPNQGNSSQTSIGSISTYYPSGTNKGSKLFMLFSVEKDITVNRLYIDIATSSLSSDASASNTTFFQLGIFDAGVIDCYWDGAYLAGGGLGYKRKIKHRWPNAKIWSSDVFDGTTRATAWPAYIQNEEGVSSAVRSLSWDVSFSLPRGVYFIALSKYIVGAGGLHYAAGLTATHSVAEWFAPAVSMPVAYESGTDLFLSSGTAYAIGNVTAFAIIDGDVNGSAIKQFGTLYADKMRESGIIPIINRSAGSIASFGDVDSLYNNGMTPPSPLVLSTITRSGDIVTVTCSVAHAMLTGDAVNITGAGDGYSGTFIITEVNNFIFTYNIWSEPTSPCPTTDVVMQQVNAMTIAGISSACGGLGLAGAFTETTPTDNW